VEEARRAVPLDLLADPCDEHLDQIRQRVEMLPPDVVGEHRAGDDLSRVPDEEFENTELARRELDATAAALDLPACDVDFQIRDLEQRRCVARAPQQRLQASEQ